MTRYETGCGLRVEHIGDFVLPLTRCCQVPANHFGSCPGCWQAVHEGYTFAALVGHVHFRRDLRTMVEALTACEHPGECAEELLQHFSGAPVDHTHVGA